MFQTKGRTYRLGSLFIHKINYLLPNSTTVSHTHSDEECGTLVVVNLQCVYPVHERESLNEGLLSHICSKLFLHKGEEQKLT